MQCDIFFSYKIIKFFFTIFVLRKNKSYGCSFFHNNVILIKYLTIISKYLTIISKYLTIISKYLTFILRTDSNI